MSDGKKRCADRGQQHGADVRGCACHDRRTTSAVRARNPATRCAVLVVLALAAFGVLSGCASGGGSASSDSALAAKVRTAIESTDYGGQVHDVTASSDGKVAVTLDSTGSSGFGDKVMPGVVANAVLSKVPAVKQLTLSWASGAQIGVYTAK
jgi:hypothetical protein